MIDALLFALVLAGATAAGMVCLRLAAGRPEGDGEALLVAAAVGLGLTGVLGLLLAAAGTLRPPALVGAWAVALVLGGRDLGRALRGLDTRGLRAAWPLVALCAVVLAAEVVTMLAPPVGGDQTKYHLVYPRLYGQAGGLVPTPWSFWGQMQFLPNFVFAVAFAVRGDVLARLLNGAFGVLGALALGGLVERHLLRGAGALAAALFFTLPMTWSLMSRAGSDLAVVLYAALATSAFLDWTAGERGRDLRRAALVAGLAGASKSMGLLVPMLLGAGVVGVAARRAWPVRRLAVAAATFGCLGCLLASPYYVRNAVETGNPLYPFAYGMFGGRNWSAQASDYLADYYQQYRTVHATRRAGEPYAGLSVLRFPWDVTMHPGSFENAARQGLDIGPFLLAFAPALVLLRGRRAVLITAALGFAYAGIIAGAAWAHPRYVVPGVTLLLVASVPAARALLGRRAFVAVVAVTILGNLAVTSRLLRPLWADQGWVAVGRMQADEFLRRHSPRFAFWERANAVVPESGRILVLEKIPHPYYIDRPFVLGSYLEQGLIDYRRVSTVEALTAVARELGVTHVAVDTGTLAIAGDPFEAAVGRLWGSFLAAACEPVLREGGYALYVLRGPTAYAARAGCRHG